MFWSFPLWFWCDSSCFRAHKLLIRSWEKSGLCCSAFNYLELPLSTRLLWCCSADPTKLLVMPHTGKLSMFTLYVPTISIIIQGRNQPSNWGSTIFITRASILQEKEKKPVLPGWGMEFGGRGTCLQSPSLSLATDLIVVSTLNSEKSCLKILKVLENFLKIRSYPIEKINDERIAWKGTFWYNVYLFTNILGNCQVTGQQQEGMRALEASDFFFEMYS